jgi:hypothetical protein
MATKYIVNNLSGQTIDGNLIINGDVTITGTTNTRPYKVYTALLTQTGGGGGAYIGTGSLTIGVTYTIDYLSANMDFTNVGAPNNNLGTAFVATGTNPTSWGEDEGLNILAYDTSAPVVTVLENTLGSDVTWWVNTTGLFYAYSDSGYFTTGKTFVTITHTNYNIDGTTTFYQSDATEISIQTMDTTFTPVDGVLYNTPIEIRVYN